MTLELIWNYWSWSWLRLPVQASHLDHLVCENADPVVAVHHQDPDVAIGSDRVVDEPETEWHQK